MELAEAIRQRHSVRAYLERPVARATVQEVLNLARWAPSGVNMQPWQVAVVEGGSKQRISNAILAEQAAGNPPRMDYDYYPAEWFGAYRDRRKACGLALYEALGIDRGETEKQIAARNRNYLFFDAPVGLFFFLDRRLGQGAWIDMGLFLQNVMLAATAAGLATCPEASLAEYPDIVRCQLDVDENAIVVCGMALGYPDPDAPVNQYRTEREPVEGFVRWFD